MAGVASAGASGAPPGGGSAAAAPMHPLPPGQQPSPGGLHPQGGGAASHPPPHQQQQQQGGQGQGQQVQGHPPPGRIAPMAAAGSGGGSAAGSGGAQQQNGKQQGQPGGGGSGVVRQLSEATAQAWGTLGTAARSMDNDTEAGRCFSRALSHNPNCTEALIGLGDLCKAQGNYRQAVELYQRVIETNPEDGGAWAELAYCFLMLNELQNSYTSYQHALYHIKNPKNAHLWYGIGLLYNRYGSYSHAIEAFDACLKMDPNFELEHEVRFRVAIIAKKQGRLDEALEVLHDVLSTVDDPSWKCDVCSQIGHVYELKRDVPAAKRSYLKALEYNKNHAKALQQLGWLHYKDEDEFNLAIEYLKRATEIDPRDALGWYLLGRCYMAAQSHESAYAAYEQAVNADPNNPNVWCSLGVLYYQLQQNRDALDAYTRAIKLDPNLCEVWYNVGTLYDSCNQTADALDAYKKAAELGASGDFIHQRIAALMSKLPPGAAAEQGGGGGGGEPMHPQHPQPPQAGGGGGAPPPGHLQPLLPRR